MKRFATALCVMLTGVAHAQDAVQAVLQAAPQLVAFAGSPENFYSLVLGLTEGKPARLGAPAFGGFARVTTIAAPVKLDAATTAAVLERARENLQVLGISQPTPEQISAALVGGVLDTPTGRTQMNALLPRAARAQVRSQLEPEQRMPSPEERAFAQLPPEIQSLLSGMPPREALVKVEYAQQQLIALGNPYPSVAQLRATLENVLAPQGGGYYRSVSSASAGATTFPPLSPLVSPYLPATR
jgi:hypothetical protein